MFDDPLSRALCLYVGYERLQIPARQAEEVVRAFGPERAMTLTPKLDEILDYAVGRTIGVEIDLPNIGRDAANAARRKYPSLSRKARKAIAWYVSQHWQ